MKLRSLQSWAVGALALLAAQVPAEAAPVRSFDINGVRVGLTETEARNALRAKLGSVADTPCSKPVLSDAIACVIYIRQPTFEMHVSILKSRSKSWKDQVNSVDYQVSTATDEKLDFAAVRRSLLKKYGKPSVENPVNSRLRWCEASEGIDCVTPISLKYEEWRDNNGSEHFSLDLSDDNTYKRRAAPSKHQVPVPKF